ncbi:DUF309 domain-containing protein [Amorphus orientalis]|uniref:DUF309 domain-containing protein n=1 Tax=Amorphus orientalis TaxID=649198 RepID=A0AAE4ASN4_9HYPH|nr:DUF309 domain-containing protein [Amorphus orientalis]MDQ0316466.1 hypothetical protein [Amorphus orientalis]
MTRAAATVDVYAWPLPSEPYVPGVTERPTASVVFEISEAAPAVTEPDRWREHEAWLAGFRLYGQGYFWETHEVWEPVWIGARPNSAERVMVQGLIQLANGCLKVKMGRPKAALRLMSVAQGCLDEAANGGRNRLMGLDLAAARDGLKRFVEAFPHTAGDAVLAARPNLEAMLDQSKI